tara:strand:+ start:928 stop:1530 length:603 start_codon:yes stop_codon:yes gene_type:complete
MKNKKSQITQLVMYYIPRIFFTIIVLFSVITLIRGYIVTQVDIQQAEAEIYAQSVLFSKHGISYYNPNLNKVNLGIFDISDLKQLETNMNENLFFGEKYDKKINRFAAKITYYFDDLEDIGKDKNTPDKDKTTKEKTKKQEIHKKSIYYREQFYNLLKPTSGISGSGGSYLITKNINAPLKYNNNLYSGKIKLEVLVPNE